MSLCVYISFAERVAAGTPDEEQKYVIHRLRSAGVPVSGTTFFLGLERGRLQVEPRDGGFLFRYKEL